MNLVVHHLHLTLQAETLVHLGPQAGAQLRGALWAALQQFACTASNIRPDPQHTQHCPMCRLMALETVEDARGNNPPRPFAVRPPLTGRIEDDRVFYTGDRFTVGINLFGDVVTLFPYICQAFYRMGEIGIGYGRGRFALQQIEAVDPLTGARIPLLQGRRIMAGPGLPLTHDKIKRSAATLPLDRITLRFLTPVFLKNQGQRLSHPDFAALIARLLERCQALELHYTERPTPQAEWRERYLALTEQAQQVRLVQDQTRWVEVGSGSRRTETRNSISGFVGEAVFEGDLSPFREWLLWGQSVHVGKNVVKGDGWYEVVRLEQ